MRCSHQAALVAVGDVYMYVRSRKALHDVMTAIRTGRPLTECGRELQVNAERHLRTQLRLAQTFPGNLLAETLQRPSAAASRLTS